MASPYRQHMADGDFDEQDALPLRELFGIACMVSGTIGLTWAGFATDFWLGIAVLSTFILVGGLALGRDR